VVDQADSQDRRKVLELLVLLINTCLFAVSFISMGGEFYLRWWHVHPINRIAFVLLVPVAIVASFFIAIFVQVGTADKFLRIGFGTLSLFFLLCSVAKLWTGGLSWSSFTDADLLPWGLALLLAVALGGRKS
jgi:hypothetical protein